MPRTYKRTRPQEENIKKVVAAVKDGGMSVRTAAKLYNVGRMTLQRRVTVSKEPLNSVGVNCLSKRRPIKQKNGKKKMARLSENSEK